MTLKERIADCINTYIKDTEAEGIDGNEAFAEILEESVMLAAAFATGGGVPKADFLNGVSSAFDLFDPSAQATDTVQ